MYRKFEDNEGNVYIIPSDPQKYDGTAEVLIEGFWRTTEWSDRFQALCKEVTCGKS